MALDSPLADPDTDLATGHTIQTGQLPAQAIRAALGSYASPRPAGGWLLDAEPRGLDGARFLLRTATRLALIHHPAV